MSGRTSGPGELVVRDKFLRYEVDIGGTMPMRDDGGGGKRVSPRAGDQNGRKNYFVEFESYFSGCYKDDLLERRSAALERATVSGSHVVTVLLVASIPALIPALLLPAFLPTLLPALLLPAFLLASDDRDHDSIDRILISHQNFADHAGSDCSARDCIGVGRGAVNPLRSPVWDSHTDKAHASGEMGGRANAFLRLVFVSCWALRPAGDGRISARTAR